MMELKSYDLIVVNTSAGKDSLAMLDYVHTLATSQGVDVIKHCQRVFSR